MAAPVSETIIDLYLCITDFSVWAHPGPCESSLPVLASKKCLLRLMASQFLLNIELMATKVLDNYHCGVEGPR